MKKLPRVGAYYQCYKQPKAVIHSLQAFRKSYPNSTVVMVSNNGMDMKHIAKYFNCDYTHSNESTSTHSTLCLTEDALKLYMRRLYTAAEKIREDYIMFLSDDVRVFNPIKEIKYDMAGGRGYWKARLTRKIKKILHPNDISPGVQYDNIMRAGGDGCVIRRQFVLDHFTETGIDKALKELAPRMKEKFNNTFPSDGCINMFVLYYGGTIGYYSGYTEVPRYDYIPRRLTNMITVSHQEKMLYNLPLSPIENDILAGTLTKTDKDYDIPRY